jgi:starvation-inducible DNA-binding protein
MSTYRITRPRYRATAHELGLQPPHWTQSNWYDDVAERMATLDVSPDGRLATLAATSSLPTAGEGWQRDVNAVTVMRDRLTEVAGRIERRAGDIGDDLVTQGLLLEIAGGLAKHAWMLRVQAR